MAKNKAVNSAASAAGMLTNFGRVRDYTVFTIAFLLLTAGALAMNYYAYDQSKEWVPGPNASEAEITAKKRVKYLLIFGFVPYLIIGTILGLYMVFTFWFP